MVRLLIVCLLTVLGVWLFSWLHIGFSVLIHYILLCGRGSYLVPFWEAELMDYLPAFLTGLSIGVILYFLASYFRLNRPIIYTTCITTIYSSYEFFVAKSYLVEGESLFYYPSLMFLSIVGAITSSWLLIIITRKASCKKFPPFLLTLNKRKSLKLGIFGSILWLTSFFYFIVKHPGKAEAEVWKYVGAEETSRALRNYDLELYFDQTNTLASVIYHPLTSSAGVLGIRRIDTPESVIAKLGTPIEIIEYRIISRHKRGADRSPTKRVNLLFFSREKGSIQVSFLEDKKSKWVDSIGCAGGDQTMPGGLSSGLTKEAVKKLLGPPRRISVIRYKPYIFALVWFTLIVTTFWLAYAPSYLQSIKGSSLRHRFFFLLGAAIYSSILFLINLHSIYVNAINVHSTKTRRLVPDIGGEFNYSFLPLFLCWIGLSTGLVLVLNEFTSNLKLWQRLIKAISLSITLGVISSMLFKNFSLVRMVFPKQSFLYEFSGIPYFICYYLLIMIWNFLLSPKKVNSTLSDMEGKHCEK